MSQSTHAPSTPQPATVRARRITGRTAFVWIALSIVAFSTIVLGLSLGSYTLSADQLFAVLTGAESGFERTVVLEWRLPRALAALGVGACLGLSGALLQTVTRNPLASPDLIGISGGAFTAVLLFVVVFGSDWGIVGPAALAGGLLTAALVFALSGGRSQQSKSRFLLVGVAVAALLSGINSWVVMSASLESAMTAAAWGAGSLATSTWQTAAIAAAVITGCGLLCAFTTRRIRVHQLGDDLSQALGAAPARLRIELLVLSVVLVSAATALCGPIGLLPLVATPIARALVRSGKAPLAASAAVGAVLLAVADLLAQHVVPGSPPAGLVTTVIGGAYLLVLILAGRKSGAR